MDTISVGLAGPHLHDIVIQSTIPFLLLFFLTFNTETKSSSTHFAVINNYMYNKHTLFPHILGDVTKLIDSLIKFILVLFHKWLNQSMIDYHRAIVGHW